jgi:hypothetical protein
MANLLRSPALNQINTASGNPLDESPSAGVGINQLGVRYTREEITWFDGSRFVLSDFWLPELKICVEANGSQHRLERERDVDKAAIILGQRGFRTLEYWNREILRPDFAGRLRRDLGLA